MRQRLLAIASKVSLVLFAAALLMWIGSYLAFAPFGQYWGTEWDGNTVHLQRCWVALNGSLHLFRDDLTLVPAPTSRPFHFLHSGVDPMPSIRLVPTTFGFARFSLISHARRGPQRTYTTQQLSFPIWLAAFVFAMLPLKRFVALVRDSNRRRRGLCRACSYDLQGNTSGVCPECGLAVTDPSSG